VTVALYSGVVADSPSDAAEQVRVSVPNLTQMDRKTYGPVAFTPKVSAAGAVRFPQRGDLAVVGIDDSGAGHNWLVTWLHADSGPASPAPSGPIFVRKSVIESRSNDSVLTDDDELFAAVEANSVYVMQGWVHWTSPTTPAIKFGWTAPAGATLDWSSSVDPDVNYTLASVMTRTGAVVHRVLMLVGLLVVGGTAGDLHLQWAQNTANGSSTTVQANSWLRLEKVA
jgi:hypothetical protein